MSEPHDPQNPADRAPYEPPADDTRPYATPAGPPPFPHEGPIQQGPIQQGPPPEGPPPGGPTPPSRWGIGSRRTLAATGVAALVVGGVVGGLIGWASTDNPQPTRTTMVAERQSTNPSTAEGKHEHARHSRGVAGTITAMNGSTWTIQTVQGDPFTVTIGADTKFGTAKAPAQASDFAVGDRIAVSGKRTGTTVDAVRVVKRVPRTGPSSPAPSAVAPS
ncbi:DUF5666 domain-containing protein [Williamsia sp. SKLECPSW1]